MSAFLILLFVCMLAIATGFSMLGQGGGALYTPIQVWLGIDFHEAATTSLFLIMMTSLSATLVYRQAGRIDWPLALVLESVTALGGLTGGLSSGRFSGALLSEVFAGIVAFAALFMVHEFHAPAATTRPAGGLFLWHRQFGEQRYRVNLLIAIPASFAAGLASGLVGVGGGILKVPLMVLLLGIPMQVAVGSSAFMVGLTAAGGFAGHVAVGHWNAKTSIILAVAVVIGAQVGARLSIGVDPDRLKKAFGWFLLAVAALMAVWA